VICTGRGVAPVIVRTNGWRGDQQRRGAPGGDVPDLEGAAQALAALAGELRMRRELGERARRRDLRPVDRRPAERVQIEQPLHTHLRLREEPAPAGHERVALAEERQLVAVLERHPLDDRGEVHQTRGTGLGATG
jgi:hypothetical protein